MLGNQLYSWAEKLFPLNRSLSGPGNRETLRFLIDQGVPLEIKDFKSGTPVGDWVVPSEWIIRDAYIESLEGKKIISWKENNLHVVGYSHPVNMTITLKELLPRVYVEESNAKAIPYVTSYYKETWGFCMSQDQLDSIGEGPFHVVIDSYFLSGSEGGVLNYGEIFIEGKSKQEVIFTSYICHPSMANNELSGPVLISALSKHIQTLNQHYSYRFLLLPETIGSIAYLHENLQRLKAAVIAGWVVTCIGNSDNFSYVESRKGNNYADKITKRVLKKYPDSKHYSWLERGSDERQFGSPNVDLPFVAISRSLPGHYPEYHTSLDDLKLVNPIALEESFEFLVSIIGEIERNRVPRSLFVGEPQLGKRGLRSTISKNDLFDSNMKNVSDILSLCDGQNTIEELATLTNLPFESATAVIELLHQHSLIDL
jgi:aminopeptidase-like protein